MQKQKSFRFCLNETFLIYKGIPQVKINELCLWQKLQSSYYSYLDMTVLLRGVKGKWRKGPDCTVKWKKEV